MLGRSWCLRPNPEDYTARGKIIKTLKDRMARDRKHYRRRERSWRHAEESGRPAIRTAANSVPGLFAR